MFVGIDHQDNVFIVLLHCGDRGTEVLEYFVSGIGVVVTLLQESLLLEEDFLRAFFGWMEMIVGAICRDDIDDTVASSAECHGTPPSESRGVLADGVCTTCPFVMADEHGATGLI